MSSRLVRIGAALAVAGTAHTVWNLRRLRVPPADPPPLAERVSVLLPLRDEAHRVRPCLEALRRVLEDDRAAELVVLDDGSTDGTGALVREVLHDLLDSGRARLVEGTTPPQGWLGKPWACAQLARAADGGSTAYLFLDADVVLAPHAVRATVALLRQTGLDLVCPYPHQRAETPAERLVQPLLQWSWLTTLPLGPAERTRRPSMGAANGQLLCVDARAYARAGGHGAVQAEVLEDLALLCAVKAAGGHGTVVDGTHVATCRMYSGWPDLRDGYAKSLWAAFGSPAGSVAVLALLGTAYVVPPLAALRGSRAGLAGYGAGVLGRVLVARRTGGRAWPDALAHPGSVILLGWLTARSWHGHRRGTLTWKARPLRSSH